MADPVSIALLVASAAIAATTTAIAVNQQNAQIEYQQDVAKQNAIAAQNKAAADMKTRRTEAARAQASTRAAMAARGIDSTSGSFLDLVGQGAAAGELDVLKAKHSGDIDSWSLNNQINELETSKKNAWLEAGLAGAQAAASGAGNLDLSSTKGPKGKPTSGKAISAAGGNLAENAGALASGASGYVGELPNITKFFKLPKIGK